MKAREHGIVEAARDCAVIIAVSQALKERMIDIGIDADRIHVLRNGVDLEVFSPISTKIARDMTGIEPSHDGRRW